MLTIIETDVDDRIAAGALFDPDDIDAAFAELDARYLAGEAAPHSRTWQVITQAYAGMTRGELPPTTADLVNIDHRHVTPMGPDDGIASLHASWDLAEGFTLYIEAVHRLSDLGAVFTRSSDATSKAGFDAEWRAIDLITVDGDRISRGEIFDESDLDAALARFDELNTPGTATRRTRRPNRTRRSLTRSTAAIWMATSRWPTTTTHDTTIGANGASQQGRSTRTTVAHCYSIGR